MTSPSEVSQEVKLGNALTRLGKVVDGGLESALARAGGTLTGYSVKSGEFDTLLVIKALLPAGRMVAFVGSGTPKQCFLKAYADANADALVCRVDRFNAKGVA